MLALQILCKERRLLNGSLSRLPASMCYSRLSRSFSLAHLQRASMAVAAYESFLIKNVSTISSLESTLRSVSWFSHFRTTCTYCLQGNMVSARPVQGRRAGVRGSCVQFLYSTACPNRHVVSTLLNVMSMYHDTLLAKVVQSNPRYRPLIPPSLHSRFTRAWSVKSDVYKWAARSLELIRFTELVVEMGLRRKVSNQSRWRGILLLEVIKCVSLHISASFTS